MEDPSQRLAKLLDLFEIKAADLAKMTGIPKSSISMWLNGKRVMRQDKIGIIADKFNIDPAWLMGYEVPMKRGDGYPDTSRLAVQKNEHHEEYYIDREAREMAQFLAENPEYKVLFDASRKVKPEDVEFVREFIERMTGGK